MNEGKVRELIYEVFISAFLVSLIVMLSYYKYISRYLLVFVSIIYFFLCFIWDTGYELDYHGDYNRKLLLLFLIFFIVIENAFILFCILIYKKPTITIIVALGLIFCGYGFYHTNVKESCIDWDKGLKGSYIIDDPKDSCYIYRPNTCWVDLSGDIMNFSKIIGEKCEDLWTGELSVYEKSLKANKNNDYMNLISSNTSTPNNSLGKNSNNKITHLGYADTKDYKYEDSLNKRIPKKIISDMKVYSMTDDEFNSKKDSFNHEVVINFTGKKSKIDINIKRDEKLVIERKERYERKGKKNLITKNLIIFYIDAFSRRHFFRKFPKTASWLEKYYSFDKTKYTKTKEYKKTNANDNKDNKENNDKENKFHTYQFLKYQSLGFFTQVNTIPSFWGKWWQDKKKEEGNNFFNYFKDNGAIAGQTQSTCSRVFFDVEGNNFKDLDRMSPDHEMVSLSCDPNYYNPDSPFTPFLGPMSIRRRCLHGKDLHDYQMIYMEKFWETYIDMPKVFLNSFIDAHESSSHVVGYLDEKIYSFLVKNENNGFLDDTNIMFYADHGNNMPTIYDLWKSLDYHYERYLPMLFLVTDTKTHKKYGDNLKHNEQALLAPWDVYHTLLHMNNKSANAIGRSILNKIDNENFSCDKFKIPAKACVCPKKQ